MNTKKFFAGLGALMIAYFVISLLFYLYTAIVVAFTGVDPNGGFDMLLKIINLPFKVLFPCILISLYSIGYFYVLSKNKRRLVCLRRFFFNFFEAIEGS